MSVMDIWIPVLVAVVTGLLSFIASTIKSNHDVQKVKIENETQMQRMVKQHKDELEKAEKENEIANRLSLLADTTVNITRDGTDRDISVILLIILE